MTLELASEDDAAAEIVARLSARFPAESTTRVIHAVEQARRHFATARVRDFVPVLVEREARAALENRN